MPHDTSTNYGVAEGGARVTLDGTKTILLVGVGGQGTILAGQLLAMVAADAGLDVKVSEIHGMSQRGGSVSTIVRVGEKVESMIADPGCADIVVAFESIEALRAQQFVREGGSLFVNDEQITPVPVNIGICKMPEGVQERLAEINARVIDAGGIARAVGSPRSTNVVLVGALSTALPFEVAEWEDAIRRRVPPATVEANLAAFARGREAVLGE
jgi:indolepyruvate ferredoxin oxidoreductase beta subunit